VSRSLALLFLALLVGALAVLLVLNRPVPVEPPRTATASPATGTAASSRAAPPPQESDSAAASAAPRPVSEFPKQELSLFFEREDTLLHRVPRQVPVPPGPAGKIRGALTGLFAGPDNPDDVTNFPAGSAVRAVFLSPPGFVTVDLDIPPESLAGFGAHQEWMSLESLVATVLTSAPEGTKGVLVTLRGESAETFAGHIDLSSPLRFDNRLLAPEEPAAPAPGQAATSSPRSAAHPPSGEGRAVL